MDPGPVTSISSLHLTLRQSQCLVSRVVEITGTHHCESVFKKEGEEKKRKKEAGWNRQRRIVRSNWIYLWYDECNYIFFLWSISVTHSVWMVVFYFPELAFPGSHHRAGILCFATTRGSQSRTAMTLRSCPNVPSRAPFQRVKKRPKGWLRELLVEQKILLGRWSWTFRENKASCLQSL